MRLRALLLTWLLGFCVACQKGPVGNNANSTAKIAAPSDPATAAEITGTVSFQGILPRPVPIDMSADPGCRGSNSGESLVVNDGKLQNVFVYVKGGFTFVPPVNPVIIEQRGCKYVPHVVGVTILQPVEFRNADPTSHNIHGAPNANDAWNISQNAQSPAMTRTFSHAETMIRVKCNQHPWMTMYINVADSPFFRVTDAQGRFTLSGIPPGTYDLVFVHEMLGQQTRTVTLAAKDRKQVDLSFNK